MWPGVWRRDKGEWRRFACVPAKVEAKRLMDDIKKLTMHRVGIARDFQPDEIWREFKQHFNIRQDAQLVVWPAKMYNLGVMLKHPNLLAFELLDDGRSVLVTGY